VIEQLGSEVPRCNPVTDPAFEYVDDPTWMPEDGPLSVVVVSSDISGLPAEILDPAAFNFNELVGDELEAVAQATDTILSIPTTTEAQAIALSNYYRNEGLLFDAISVLVTLPDIGCTSRRPSVDPPSGPELPLLQTPVVYLRLGELFQMLGQVEDATRYYRCAADLSDALGDPANAALAYARLASLAEALETKTQLYQFSINNYAALGASDNATAMLDRCGSSNCALP
jgi:hypothetical protein